jgi:chromosome segregation ATPase
VSAAAASDSTAGTPAAQLTATLVAERDALQANVDRLQEAVDDLRRQLAESQLQLGRWETQSSTCTQAQQQLEEEIADWKRCRHEQHAEFDGRQRELEYAEHQHAAWVAQWRNEWAVRTADLDVRRDALRRYEAQLAAEWAAIERARDDLTQRTTEWAERLAQLTAGCQAADRRRVEQESRLQREAEQLLVRRIRLQRQFRRHEEELKQRQQELMLWHDELMQRQEDLARQQVELTERHLQLDQREIALPGPTPAPGAPSVPNGRARTIPLPPGVSELAVQPSSVAADSAAETCHDEPFELANPLLESADFTELLSEFLLVEQDESDEA